MNGESSTTVQPSPYLQSMYDREYGNSLSRHDQNYQQILNAYAANQAAIQQGASGVANDYGRLQGDVLRGIQGIGASQATAIRDQYAAEAGKQSQNLISRGLGNTTVANSVQRGLTLDQQKAQVALANQIAGLTANYQASIGGAGLQARMQALSMSAAQGNNLIGALAGYRMPFPHLPPSSQSSRSMSGYPGGQQGGISGIAPRRGGSIMRPFDTGGGGYAAASMRQGAPNPYAPLGSGPWSPNPFSGSASPYSMDFGNGGRSLNIGDAWSDMGGYDFAGPPEPSWMAGPMEQGGYDYFGPPEASYAAGPPEPDWGPVGSGGWEAPAYDPGQPMDDYGVDYGGWW